MYTAIDIVNIKADYQALKKSSAQLSRCMEDICVILDRMEYFLGHFEDADLVDDLPL